MLSPAIQAILAQRADSRGVKLRIAPIRHSATNGNEAQVEQRSRGLLFAYRPFTRFAIHPRYSS
jgi:hypothetical protein